MKLSKYTHLFNDKGQYFLFNAETVFFSEIDKELYTNLHDREFDRIPEAVMGKLKEKRVVIEDTETDLYFYNCKTNTLLKAYDTRTLTIVIAPTTGCNFECPYCFEPKKNPKTMTPEVENRIIEFINSKTHAENIAITWYGGEPLLAFDIIERLYDRIVAETGKKITAHGIITNGFLINNRIIDFFKRSGLKNIQISFDGIKKNHDQSRYLKDGHKPTFDRIVANMEKLARAIPELNIQARVNINRENVLDFAEIFKMFSDHDWCRKVNVYPGIIHEDSVDGATICSRCYTESNLPELYELIEQSGVPVNYLPKISNKGCILQSVEALIIGPEGELYKCWEDVSKPERIIGSIMEGNTGDYRLMMRYLHECGAFDEECKKCSVFPVCWGGCGYRRYRNLYNGAELELCSPLKNPELMKRVMLDFIRAGKPEAKKFVSMF